MKSDLIDITVIVKHKTALAVLVDHGGKEPVWIPLSQIEIEPNKDGKTYTITMPEWMAVDKGLV